LCPLFLFFFFFFNDTATTEIYTLSLHDALPIYLIEPVLPYFRVEGTLRNPELPGNQGEVTATARNRGADGSALDRFQIGHRRGRDRKSTRLNSSHDQISYAVFCLKKKKNSTHIV